MTNEEKYEEVFGMKPDHYWCPAIKCKFCPLYEVFRERWGCNDGYRRMFWWEEEYGKEIDVDACKEIVRETDRRLYELTEESEKKDICDTCKKGDDCGKSTKIFSNCSTSICHEYEDKEADNED